MSLKENLLTFAGKFQSENIAKSYPFNYCIPVYHTVSNENLPHLKHIINYKNEKEFERDLDEMLQHFQFVNWDEFKDFVNGNFKPKKKIALLTFDDGLSEFHDVVVPILERKGIFAINFINPKFIDNQDLMYRCKASLLIEKISKLNKNRYLKILKEQFNTISSKDLIKKIQQISFQAKDELDEIAQNFEVDFKEFLKINQPYLNVDQLKTLTQKGFGISNHGFDHPLYHQLTLEEQINNTEKSYHYLKEHQFIHESFAFPFTDFGMKKDFFDELFQNKNLFCTFGSAGLKLDGVEENFQRIPMENGKNATLILKEEIAYFKFKKIFNKNTIHRK